MRNFLSIGFFVIIIALFSSCNNDAPKQSRADGTSNETISKTRSMSSSIAAAYNYKSLTTFKKGKNMMNMSLDQLADLEGKEVNLVVLYDTEAPWAEIFSSADVISTTGDENFNSLLKTFELYIIKQFQLDEMNEGLVLAPNKVITNPVEAAREISMIDYVLMVHVKEVPQENPSAQVNEQ